MRFRVIRRKVEEFRDVAVRGDIYIIAAGRTAGGA